MLLECIVFLEPLSEVFYGLFRLHTTAMALLASTAACIEINKIRIRTNHMHTTMNSDLGVQEKHCLGYG